MVVGSKVGASVGGVGSRSKFWWGSEVGQLLVGSEVGASIGGIGSRGKC